MEVVVFTAWDSHLSPFVVCQPPCAVLGNALLIYAWFIWIIMNETINAYTLLLLMLLIMHCILSFRFVVGVKTSLLLLFDPM
jgi:hypothetical protein